MRRAWRMTALCATIAGGTAAADSPDPGFASCAAYYFLAARGHGMQDYDRLYSAGEFSLNEAIRRHGEPAARARMERVSGTMMEELHHDWREIDTLDRRYGAPCERLLRDADYR